MTSEKQSEAKAKLDSKGRPIAVQVPDKDKQDDKGKTVAPLARMGVLLLACFAQQGCETAVQVDPLEVESRLEAAITEARAAAAQARETSKLASLAAKDAIEATALCLEAMSK